MSENIKTIIESVYSSDDKLIGSDIVVRTITHKDKTTSKNSLIKKDFFYRDGKKIYFRDRGFNLSDLRILKNNWNKILGAMIK